MAEEAPADWLTLEQTAERVGAYRWVERRLFEATGRWALDDTHPRAQLFFDRLRAEHAWHAELWSERLPVLDWIDREGLTRAPSPAVGALLARLDGLVPQAEGTEGRLVALARVVLPRLVVTYRTHLDRSTPAADGPVRRALALVLADTRPAWEDAELLVEALSGAPGSARRVADTQAELEELLVGTGGAGLFDWPLSQGKSVTAG